VRPRLTSDALLLGGLLVVTLIVAMFGVRSSGRREEESEFPARRTTYSPNRGGYQALYEAMEALRYPVHRWRYSLETLKEPGTLIVASPESAITAAEWRALAQWVQAGNLLICLTDEGGLFGRRRGREALMGTARRTSRPAQPCPPAEAAPELRTRNAFYLDQEEWAPVAWETREDEGQPTPVMSMSAAVASSPLVPLYRDERGVTVAYTSWGRGAVVLSSSPWSLSTVGVGQADNFLWLLSTIAAYGPAAHRAAGRPGSQKWTPQHLAPIWFDEFHHGYGQKRGVLSLLAPIARVGLAQLAIAWLLLAYAASRRFGGRVPDEDRVRRSRSEYLGGMASLLARARAVDLAVAQVRRQFISDAVRALGLPRDAERPVLIQAAAGRGLDPERLRVLLERADRIIDERDRSRQEEALAVARELVQVRQQLAAGRGSPGA
jgi:uncharacterized protein DUF4350